MRRLGWLEEFLVGQHGAGGGWIARAIRTDTQFDTAQLAHAVAHITSTFPTMRVRLSEVVGELWWTESTDRDATPPVVVTAPNDSFEDATRALLNQRIDPLRDALHRITPIGTDDRFVGLVASSSHAVSDGFTMTALTAELADSLRGSNDSATRQANAASWTLAPSLETAIGPRGLRPTLATVVHQIRAGYLTHRWRERGTGHGAPSSEIQTRTGARSDSPAGSSYQIALAAVIDVFAAGGRDTVRVLTTVDTRRQRSGLDRSVGYLASGFVDRYSPDDTTHGSRTRRWEDPPGIHRWYTRLFRRSPSPAVDLALSVQDLAGRDGLAVLGGGASVHGHAIALHLFVYVTTSQVTATVVFDPGRADAELVDDVLARVVRDLASK